MPKEEDLDVLMSSVCCSTVHACAGGKRGKWGGQRGGAGERPLNKAIDSEHGTCKGGSSQPCMRSYHSK